MVEIYDFNKIFAERKILEYSSNGTLPSYINEDVFLQHYDNLDSMFNLWNKWTNEKYCDILDTMKIQYQHKNKINSKNIDVREMEMLKQEYKELVNFMSFKHLDFKNDILKNEDMSQGMYLCQELSRIVSKVSTYMEMDENDRNFMNIFRMHKENIFKCLNSDIKNMYIFVEKWYLHTSPQGVILVETVKETLDLYKKMKGEFENAIRIFQYIGTYES